MAAAIRLTEVTPRRCALALCRSDRVAWAACSPTFRYRVNRGMPLHPQSLAMGTLAGHPMPDWPTRVPALAWLRVLASRSELELVEHCVAVPSMQGVLSFLWNPEG